MNPESDPIPGAPMRADALRNRSKILAAARDAYSDGDAGASLDAIAQAAGVGIGTLYRHFPTREALVDALYATELDAVIAAAPSLLEDYPADRALHIWAGRYFQFVELKHGMFETLRSGWAAGTIATPDTRSRVTETIAAFLSAGSSAGVLRNDVDAKDVTASLIGIQLGHAVAGDSPAQRERLLDLLLDGLATGAAHSQPQNPTV
ncbi:TetR/AcrR family transcriptional regulator [Brevibacterium sp. RIT803]|nr:TetR/AcrR family transcriptional regulator [Brevibacterium sp. RIT 803]